MIAHSDRNSVPSPPIEVRTRPLLPRKLDQNPHAIGKGFLEQCILHSQTEHCWDPPPAYPGIGGGASAHNI